MGEKKPRSESSIKKDIQCYKCRKKGHIKREYPEWKKGNIENREGSSKSGNVEEVVD